MKSYEIRINGSRLELVYAENQVHAITQVIEAHKDMEITRIDIKQRSKITLALSQDSYERFKSLCETEQICIDTLYNCIQLKDCERYNNTKEKCVQCMKDNIDFIIVN